MSQSESPWTSQTQVPAQYAQEDMEKLILARGIFGQRDRIISLTFIVVLILIGLILLSHWTHELNTLDVALNSGLALGYCIAILVMIRLPDEKLYGALFTCVMITLAVLCLLLGNELYGSRRAHAAADSYPYVVAYIPMEVLFIHAFLHPRVAWKVTAGYIMTCAAIVLIPPLFMGDDYNWTSGTVWTLICVTLVSVIAGVLAYMNQNNHAEVLRAVTLEKKRLEAEIQRLAQAEVTDALTGGLNEQGIRKALRTDLSSCSELLVGMLQIHHEHLDQAEVDTQTLQRIALHVENLLGEETRWGRMNEHIFVVWAPGVPLDMLKHRLQSMPAAFAGNETIDYSITSSQFVEGKDIPNPEFDLLIEAENRLFINSMEASG